MIRALFLLLILGNLAARASEPINAPQAGASASVSQPHITAELIPETTSVEPGKPFDVALHLHADPDWHTYWINPGDAGLATTLKWTLPPGFTAGPIQWPTPEKHNMGPLIIYGYGGDAYLLTTITPPKSGLPRHFNVKAHAEWLACKEECIPGHADLTLPLDSGLLNLRLPVENKDFIDQARARLPVPNTRWEVQAYTLAPKNNVLFMDFSGMRGLVPSDVPKPLRFFPEQPNVLSTLNADNTQPEPIGKSSSTGFRLQIALQQNGEKPDKLSGVLVSDQPLIGSSKSVYISELPVTPYVETATQGFPLGGPGYLLPGSRNSGTGSDQPVAAAGPRGGSPSPSANTDDGSFCSAQDTRRPPLQTAQPPSGGPATTGLPAPPQATGSAQPVAVAEGRVLQATVPSSNGDSVARSATATTEVQPWFIGVLGAAFLGGLILNLMPCVLPVLSLKVFSLMKHAGENPRAAWKQGAAFTAGVVLSFWVLAGLLLALRAAGNQLGWGFQMQSPGFVLALIFLFFLLALNLFGVFEFGASLVGIDAKATSHARGLTSSFLNGALATLAATPCTAPFMGGALGFAAQQPPFIALVIFTFLALGMAFPYLLLTIFPGALRFVPKPGAWMEAFKQFMGFLLMATVIWLVYVFGALVGQDQIPGLLLTLLIWALVAWIYGRWGTRHLWVRLLALAFIVAYLISMYDLIAMSALKAGGAPKVAGSGDEAWQPWSPAAVDAALAQGRSVFVDFTAAWCLSCKVNERVALDTDAVRQAFAQKNVVLLRADWTHADPAISAALRQYNRDGVPLYLLYSPKKKEAPQVLPAVLTPGIVLEALQGL